MGVDLTLLPVDYDRKTGGMAFSRLKLERRSELWDDVQKLPSHPIAEFSAYVRDNYQEFTSDCYDDGLEYVYAKDLLTLKDHPAVLDNDQNRAIWGFLAAVRPDRKIVLYWS